MIDKPIVQLYGIRVIAVFFVFFNHWLCRLEYMHDFAGYLGAFGVNVFFVLSGFLISTILLNAKHQKGSKIFLLKQFYIRRCLRIFPLYYLVIFIGIAFNIPGAKTNMLHLLLYVANWRFAFNGGELGMFGHFWSLSVEEQFYLISPITLLIVPDRYIRHLALVFILIGITSRLIPFIFETHLIDNNRLWAYAGTNCCFDGFGFGILLTHLFLSNKEKLQQILKRLKPFSILALLLSLIQFVKFGPASPITIITGRALVSFFSFWLIGRASINSYTGKTKLFLENKFIIYLGKISYGLYVFHYFVAYIYDKVKFTHSGTWRAVFVTFFVFLLTTILISAASYEFIEKPLNALKKHFNYYKKNRAPVTA